MGLGTTIYLFSLHESRSLTCHTCVDCYGIVFINFSQTSGKRKRMPLVLCETENGGMLREAAVAKNDEKILLKIRDKDCVAIEVRYQ